MSEVVEVTGADESAAADYFQAINGERPTVCRDTLLAQIIASHRHEATRALSAQVEELREVLQRLHDYDSWGDKGFHASKAFDAKSDARTLLAKHKETGA